MAKISERYVVVTDRPDARIREQWDDLIENSEFATHFVTPDFVTDPYAGLGERFAVLATCDGKIDAALTGLRQGRKILSGLPVRPQTAFRRGTDKFRAADSLSQGLLHYAGSEAGLITFFSWEPMTSLERLGYEHEECSGSGQILLIELGDGAESIFQRFSPTRRTTIRNCIKDAKLTVKQLETEAELAELHQLHKVWCAGKGLPADDPELFKTLLGGESRAVFLALYEGKIVAATYIRFCLRGIAEYAANNSLQDYRGLHPNELLLWRAIEWACAAGMNKFSLGGSHPFLARFGGHLVSAHRYRLDRTFGHRYVNRERVSRLAVQAYQSLPEPLRKGLKSAAAMVKGGWARAREA